MSSQHSPKLSQRTLNRIALGISLCFIVLAICYSAITPPFESPDEASHFLYIDNLLKEHRLPILEDRPTMFNSQSVQRHHPPLYYLLGAALVSWTSRADVDTYLQTNPFATTGTVSINNLNAYLHPLQHPGDTGTAIWILRLFSMTLGTATLWFIYKIGTVAFENPTIGLIAMFCTACIPQFIFISASINNDNLVTLTYTVGIYFILRMWQQSTITMRDTLILSVVLAAAALSKLTGLTLYGLVYFSLMLGLWCRRYSWKSVLRLVLISVLFGLLLSGWWYLRNWVLYNDPLAMKATLAIWGRGNVPITRDELFGIWYSFWMLLGYFNLRGPDWFYGYVAIITLIGGIGVVLCFIRSKKFRYPIGWLLLVCILVTGSLLVATRQINISQGRLLFPAIGAFTCLLAVGWNTLFDRLISTLHAPLFTAQAGRKFTVSRVGTQLSVFLLTPMIVLALVVPVGYLAAAYQPLTIVDKLPQSVQPLSVRADTLEIRGYQLASTAADSNIVHFWLYFSGWHKDNPHLFVKALRPSSTIPIGSVDLFPGMTSINSLQASDDQDANRIYKADIRVPIQVEKDSAPFEIALQLGWNHANQFLSLQNEQGAALEALVLRGPVWSDTLMPPMPQTRLNVHYGERINFTGYTLASTAIAGKALDITFYWDCQSPLHKDLIAAIGLLDEANHIITQADGIPLGYPTSVWICGKPFVDKRTFSIPQNTAPGNYRLYVGWYDPLTGERLTAQGENVTPDNLFKTQVTVSKP